MFAYLKQSTASQTRIIGPFVDETDFKTAETGLTIANTDIKLSKNGASVVDKNSGGGTHITNGNYAITLDATDTNTVGELFVSVVESGALQVVAKFWVLEEAIYDALFGASAAGFDANQRVDVIKVAGTTQTARDLGASVLLSSGTGTGQVSLSSGTVTVGTNNDKTGYGLSSAAVQAIWDALTSALTTANSIGKRIVDFLTGDIYARLGAPAGASVSADVAAVKSDTGAIKTKTDNLPSDPADASVVAGLIAAVEAKVDTIDNFLDTEIAAIKATTDSVKLKKNTAHTNYMFQMWDPAGDPATSLTVTAERSLDGGAYAACANSVSELSAGTYKLDLADTDTNADKIMYKFTATGARPTYVRELTTS